MLKGKTQRIEQGGNQKRLGEGKIRVARKNEQ